MAKGSFEPAVVFVQGRGWTYHLAVYEDGEPFFFEDEKDAAWKGQSMAKIVDGLLAQEVSEVVALQKMVTRMYEDKK